MNQAETQKLIASVMEARAKKIEPLVGNLLISMFEKDLPVHDASYIEARVREVMTEAIESMNFLDGQIMELRRKALRQAIESCKEALPKARTYRKKKDATEMRNARCEPVVFEVLEQLLSDLLLSDEDYIGKAIIDQDKQLFQLTLFGYTEQLFAQLELVLNKHLLDATRIKWDGREKEQISMRQVDQTLKSQNTSKVNK